ncbi:hypothetical protein HARCEL1_04515 [Halococcoides cellulosivorans]|uniref:MBL fold metallo-hydrolase n=1 Tax=Halococcoides cellulosivorans TaxID=1679096 RepID=A0A2R4X4A2_9EURY|nr:hypothetical protein HARCEL1_04515 [Halococcoides cellulosivorans]
MVDRTPRSLGWQSHPHETGRRTSHAIRGPDGVWIVDPLDAPGIDATIESLGEIAGVAVCSNLHTRDAARFAERYDVPVTVPEWLDLTADLDVPIERVTDRIGPWPVRRVPVPGWDESILIAHDGATLYVPDVLGPGAIYSVGPERIGLYPFARLRPPHASFADLDPERIVFGHGTAITDDPSGALETAFDGARRRIPRAIVENGLTHARLLAGVFTDR